ncbi:hypothetical protein ACQEU3_23315 [Spirillospora sp. CA-253888]
MRRSRVSLLDLVVALGGAAVLPSRAARAADRRVIRSGQCGGMGRAVACPAKTNGLGGSRPARSSADVGRPLRKRAAPRVDLYAVPLRKRVPRPSGNGRSAHVRVAR